MVGWNHSDWKGTVTPSLLPKECNEFRFLGLSTMHDYGASGIHT